MVENKNETEKLWNEASDFIEEIIARMAWIILWSVAESLRIMSEFLKDKKEVD